MLEKENRRRERIEEEIKEKKKEQGKVARELTKVEQSIKESVSKMKFIITWCASSFSFGLGYVLDAFDEANGSFTIELNFIKKLVQSEIFS